MSTTSSPSTVAGAARVAADIHSAHIGTIAVDDGVLAVSAAPLISWGTDIAAREASVVDEAGKVVWAAGQDPLSVEARVPITLAPFGRYRAEVRTTADEVLVAGFETGPLDDEDWNAAWVTGEPGDALRTNVDLPSGAERIRLHLAAQGLVRVIINGEHVNAGRLDPVRTDRQRALSRTFDLSGMTRDGANVVQLVLGLGAWGASGEDPRVRAQIDWVVNGERATVPLDAAEIVRSPVVAQELFYRERIDDRVSLTPRTPQRRAEVVEEGLPDIVAPDVSPSVRVIETITATEIARVDGVRVYDVGTNIAGRARVVLESTVPADTVITAVHGEHLDARNRVHTGNIAMPYDRDRERQVFEWLPRGTAGERGEPWFAYYGFRYVEVRGLPDDARVAVEARVLHSDLNEAMTYDTDDDTIRALISATKQTAINNLHGVPEDCPTREQAAWTGDMASAAEWELAAFDGRSFFEKWLRDLSDGQAEDGALAGVLPDVRGAIMPPDAVWGSALPRIARAHWLHYGDSRVIDDVLPALRRWVEYLLARVGSLGIVDGIDSSYGHDWLALDQTPPELLHTAAAIDTIEVLAELEMAVDPCIDTRAMTSRADALREAAAFRFVAADGTVANGSQGSFAAALAAGILDDAQRASALARIVDDIRHRGYRVSTGYAATRWLVEALAAGDCHDVIAAVLRQGDEPGVGAMLVSGPGTLWENWWIDPHNNGTGSLNHVGLGAPFAAWAVRDLAGLSPTASGWRRGRFAPRLVADVGCAHVRLQTVRGEVSGGWRRTDGERYTISLVVPAGVEIDIDLPNGTSARVGSGQHEWTVDGSRDRHAADERPQASEARADTTWTVPPAILPRSSDVDREPIASLSPVPGPSDPEIVVIDQLACMPIPHAQFPHSVALVRARAGDVAPSVMFTVDDADSARFAYAYVDLCLDLPPATLALVIRAHLSDGTMREGAAKVWPAAWNRVVVELAPDDRVLAVEVGVEAAASERRDSVSAYEPDSRLPVAFHMGAVGFSGRDPRW